MAVSHRQEYRRFWAALFAAYHPRPMMPPHLVACGGCAGGLAEREAWFLSRFLAAMKTAGLFDTRISPTSMVSAVDVHYYATSGSCLGTALEFNTDQWFELLARSKAIEGVIVTNRSVLDGFDPERKIQLGICEWGCWHPTEKGKAEMSLYNQSSMRDALCAALTLDVSTGMRTRFPLPIWRNWST